jgi:hypothetical protein
MRNFHFPVLLLYEKGLNKIMALQFIGPALQGASFISRVGVPLLQSAGISAGLAGLGAAANAFTNKPGRTGREKLIQTWGRIPGSLNSTSGGGFGYSRGRQPSYMDASGNTYDAVSGRLLYAAKPKRTSNIEPNTFTGVTQTSTPIVMGTRDGITADRSQSDEYRSQMAQYGSLIGQNKTQEAEDLGMKIWMQKYGQTPMAQAGGAIGAYNPLLANMFPETGGFAAGSQPVEEVQMGDLGTRAQGETGYTMESLNPVAAQAAQQEATAKQADKATTVKLPIRNRVQQFLYGGM